MDGNILEKLRTRYIELTKLTQTMPEGIDRDNALEEIGHIVIAIKACERTIPRNNPRCHFGNYQGTLGDLIDKEYLNKKISQFKSQLGALQGTWVDRCRPLRWIVIKYFNWRMVRMIKKL